MDATSPAPGRPTPPANADRRYSLQEFVEATAERDRGQGFFEHETERILEVNLNGMVWTKMGSMIAYNGQMNFVREGILQQGLGNLLKKAVSGEGAKLTKVTGTGQLYLADAGKKISIIDLGGDAMFVNGSDLLAFEEGITNKITMMKKASALLSGGLFNIRLEGHGLIAITSHYEPLTLPVSPGQPVFTDPNATVAWSGGLTPELKTDIQLKSLVGRGSGESFQMKFEGEGFVVVQPFEEVSFQAQG